MSDPNHPSHPFDPALLDFDRDFLWHPYTASRSDSPPFPVVAAQGCLIELADGRQLVDGMASWWAAIHGYRNAQLDAAITQQLGKMAHVMFGGLTHEPAILLGQQLQAILPPTLERIFYCDSGSVAVEVALKMAVQYQLAKGYPQRQRMLALHNAYHGDTLAAMSVCDPDNSMHQSFAGILPQQLFVPSPADMATDQAVAALESTLEASHQEIAALIIEPVVQGAGGMKIYDAQYLKHARSLCNQYDVALIFDEIATGFGRTGEMFALQHSDEAVPDILCLGKAMTGGYMSFAATVAAAAIADAIDDSDPGVLMHGPTYMANPLACTVAARSIALLQQSPWQQRIAAIEQQASQALAEIRQIKGVRNTRYIGAIAVVETDYPVPQEDFCAQFVEQGVWVRPFRNLVYIMPPYTISNPQLAKLFGAMQQVLHKHTL